MQKGGKIFIVLCSGKGCIVRLYEFEEEVKRCVYREGGKLFWYEEDQLEGNLRKYFWENIEF